MIVQNTKQIENILLRVPATKKLIVQKKDDTS